MIENTVVELVKKKLYHVLKDDLVNIALEKGFINKKSVSKKRVYDAIIENINKKLAIEIAKKHPGKVGLSGNEVKELLNITEKERMEKMQNTIDKWILNKEKYIVLDVETTGLYEDDEIVEIAAIDLDGNILIDSLVKPTRPIPEDVIRIHGITNEMVKEAPTIKDLWSKIHDIIKEKTILSYNSDFDTRMIKQSLAASGIKPIPLKHECVMELVTEWLEYRPKLQAFSGEIQSHRAVDDCFIVFEGIIKNYASIKKE